MDARQKRDDEILERLRRICLAFPEADEATLQDRPLFHVHRRRFAIFNGAHTPPRPRWAGAGCSIHFLTDPAERAALRADHRFTPSPHHGDRGWLALPLPPPTLETGDAADNGARRAAPRTGTGADWQEIAELLEAAYRTAAPGHLVEQLDAGR